VLAIALNGLSSLAADEGDVAGAREVKEQALKAFQSLGDQWVVAFTTGALGRVCLLAGDYAAARTFLREFLTLVRDLGNKWTIPYAIELIADICSKENDARKAVQLYGAASEQREALALDLAPAELDAHRAALTQLRAELPPEEFDQEWHKGRSLGFQATTLLSG
jgi:hypothetical protein